MIVGLLISVNKKAKVVLTLSFIYSLFLIIWLFVLGNSLIQLVQIIFILLSPLFIYLSYLFIKGDIYFSDKHKDRSE